MKKIREASKNIVSEIDLKEFIKKTEEQFLLLNQKIDKLLSSQAAQKITLPKSPSIGVNKQTGQPFQHQKPQEKKHFGRPMYKTICAECGKECEVPFKPTGERPIFCKPCFTNRKKPFVHKNQDNTSVKENTTQKPESTVTAPEQRHITVVKKGVGKVTISEIMPTALAGEKPLAKSKKKVQKKKR